MFFIGYVSLFNCVQRCFIIAYMIVLNCFVDEIRIVMR